jgi:hypothetical protein
MFSASADGIARAVFLKHFKLLVKGYCERWCVWLRVPEQSANALVDSIERPNSARTLVNKTRYRFARLVRQSIMAKSWNDYGRTSLVMDGSMTDLVAGVLKSLLAIQDTMRVTLGLNISRDTIRGAGVPSWRAQSREFSNLHRR